MFLHSFTVKPELQNPNGTILVRKENEQAVFNCSADGIPAPKILWRRGGQLLFETENKFSISDMRSDVFRDPEELPGLEGTTSMLTVQSLTAIDSERYSCRADNGAGPGVVMQVPYTLNVINGMHTRQMCPQERELLNLKGMGYL